MGGVIRLFTQRSQKKRRSERSGSLRILCVRCVKQKYIMTENEIATKILDVAFALHRFLGPGLLESVYERTLEYDLLEAGLSVQSQLAVPLVYKEIKV